MVEKDTNRSTWPTEILTKCNCSMVEERASQRRFLGFNASKLQCQQYSDNGGEVPFEFDQKMNDSRMKVQEDREFIKKGQPASKYSSQ